MDQTFTDATFTHARVIIGIVTGFSMARLLTGVAQQIQGRARPGGRAQQLAWAVFFLLWVTHFWCFEFGPGPEGGWGFGLYLFTILYAALFFFTCVVLFPDRPEPAGSGAVYLRANRAWFYGLLAALFVADAAFVVLKGAEHVAALGWAYFVKQGLLVAAALSAVPPRSARFDAVFVAAAILIQIWWLLRTFAPAL